MTRVADSIIGSDILSRVEGAHAVQSQRIKDLEHVLMMSSVPSVRGGPSILMLGGDANVVTTAMPSAVLLFPAFATPGVDMSVKGWTTPQLTHMASEWMRQLDEVRRLMAH